MMTLTFTALVLVNVEPVTVSVTVRRVRRVRRTHLTSPDFSTLEEPPRPESSLLSSSVSILSGA